MTFKPLIKIKQIRSTVTEIINSKKQVNNIFITVATVIFQVLQQIAVYSSRITVTFATAMYFVPHRRELESVAEQSFIR